MSCDLIKMLLTVHWIKDYIRTSAENRLSTNWSLGNQDAILKSATFSHALLVVVSRLFYKNALRWIPLELTDNMSAVVQVMSWCHQASGHYLWQCGPRCMLPYDITMTCSGLGGHLGAQCWPKAGNFYIVGRHFESQYNRQTKSLHHENFTIWALC